MPAYILHHVEALAQIGLDIFFVSNSPLSGESRAKLSRLCCSIRERENRGYDFGAWRDELASIDLSEYDGLLLTNSSIIGPLHPLEPILREMNGRDCDFWGLTLNRLFEPHLQSFFLYFNRKVLASEAWCTFWQNVEYFDDKRDVILNYELKLLSHLKAAQFKGDSYISPNPWWTYFIASPRPTSPKTRIYYDDPTIMRAIQIIRSGFPYVKASLFWGEAEGVGPTFDEVRNAVETDYDWNLIRPLVGG